MHSVFTVSFVPYAFTLVNCQSYTPYPLSLCSISLHFSRPSVVHSAYTESWLSLCSISFHFGILWIIYSACSVSRLSAGYIGLHVSRSVIHSVYTVRWLSLRSLSLHFSRPSVIHSACTVNWLFAGFLSRQFGYTFSRTQKWQHWASICKKHKLSSPQTSNMGRLIGSSVTAFTVFEWH